MAYAFRIDPNKKVKLKDYDPGGHGDLNKKEGEALAEELGKEMGELQDLLFSAGETAFLIVLQGLDTSGKDGTIRHIARYVNAQSCNVAPFKVPSELEQSHDYLWRIHQQAPAKGHLTIFNRSHYEDVLVVRVHDLVAKDVWKKRFDHINAFEKMLVDNGTIVVKFFLHISKDEQEERLLDREKDTTKAWKLAIADWKEREHWDDYVKAYEDVLTQCSTDYAPWYVVPANHKWYRNLAITEQIVHELRPYRKEWLKRLEEIGKQSKMELEAFRAQLNANKEPETEG